jgi:hypothetical protein
LKPPLDACTLHTKSPIVFIDHAAGDAELSTSLPTNDVVFLITNLIKGVVSTVVKLPETLPKK